MVAPVATVPASVEMLRTLVSFPTVSRDSNLDLIHFVRDRLQALDADIRLTCDDTGRKANLFATVGPRDGRGILLSGHTDVVPVDGQDWTVPPFELTARDGRYYGRGSADMKGFLAVALTLAPEFVARGLRQPLHFALSYDEELGCIGVGRMIDDMVRAGISPACCIVGEPTMMKPVVAHKGKRSYRCHVTGLSVHSAYAPHGVNAVEAAAEAIAWLRGRARRYRESGPFDAGYDVPHTTVHTGVIRGGTALNIVPRTCEFDFEVRHLPVDDPALLLRDFEAYLRQNLEPGMKTIDPDTGFQIEKLSDIPALDTPLESEVVGLVQQLTGTNEIGKVAFGTEASQFQRAGTPAVVCGPGSISQAHKPDEFVAADQLARCEDFVRGVMRQLC